MKDACADALSTNPPSHRARTLRTTFALCIVFLPSLLRAQSETDFYDAAVSLLGQKKYEEAESLLLQGYEGMKELEATLRVPQRLLVAEAGSRVVRFYELTNQPENARVWREKVNAKLPNAASGGAK